MQTSVAKKRYMKNRNSRGRDPVKREEITNYIRDRVVGGKWMPGQLIPSRAELGRRFQTTPVTVQRAVNPLIEDGFLCAEGPRGTFVSQTPPHLTRFALVFPHDPLNPSEENAFLRTLAEVGASLGSDSGLDIVPFYKLYGDLRCEEYLELVREVNAGKLAGIIFATNPFLLENTPVLDRPGIPRVAFMDSAVYPQVKTIAFHREELQAKALRYIAECGKRRPCVVLPDGGYREDLMGMTRAMGLEMRPEWVQIVDQGKPRRCENLARLLFSSNSKVRPDSIFIGDDNTIPYLIRGAKDALGDELASVTFAAHSNFPSEARYEVPVKLFGYNIPALLQQAIDMVLRQRQGVEVADFVAEPCEDIEFQRLGKFK
jgi:DNA-binding LacI/PurR family transcriptional regulator